MISSISLFKNVNAVVPESLDLIIKSRSNSFWITASPAAAAATAVNLNSITTFLARGASPF